MYLSVSAIFALVIPSVLEVTQSLKLEKRIFDGRHAVIRDYPYIAAFISLNRRSTLPAVYERFGYGSIINDQWIITSAWCLFTFGVNEFLNKKNFAIVGNSLVSEKLVVDESNEDFYEFDSLEIENFTGDFDYNPSGKLALIKVKRPFKWSEKVKPVSLPKPGENLEILNRAFVAAPENYQYDHKYVYQTLREVQISIFTNKACNFSSKSEEETFYCAFFMDGYPCYVDTGAGLIIDRNGHQVLHGIISLSTEDECRTELNKIKVTKVAPHLDWIKKTISSNDTLKMNM